MAMGKMGGREPNYHSDLDVVFLYEGEGMTQHAHTRGRSGETTSNGHFFSQLGQRIIKVFTQLGPYGRLYEMDPRLRPAGKSGPLAVSFETLAKYFASGQGQLWERQAFCKSRPISGSAAAQEAAMQHIRHAIVAPGWKPADADEIRSMRRRMQESATPRNLKRGPGGTVDIEFLVQMLQLRHVAEAPQVLTPGTLDALDALHAHGAIGGEDHEYFSRSYRLLRSIEAGLRLMNTTARHDLPDDETSLEMLAYLLRWENHEELAQECRNCMVENRRRFERVFEAAGR
jgi:glutamate-ammonia-ligase adenylyltransferase